MATALRSQVDGAALFKGTIQHPRDPALPPLGYARHALDTRQKQTTREAQTTKHARMVMGLVLLDALVKLIKVWGSESTG